MIIFGVLVVFLSVKLRESGRFHGTHLTEKLISSLDRHPTPDRSLDCEDAENGNPERFKGRRQSQWSSLSSGNSSSGKSYSHSAANSIFGTNLAPPIDDAACSGMIISNLNKKDIDETSLKTLLVDRSQDGGSVKTHTSIDDHMKNAGECTLDRLYSNCDIASRQTQSTLHLARTPNDSASDFDMKESAAPYTRLSRNDSDHNEEGSRIWWNFNEAFYAMVSNHHNDDNKFRMATMEAALSTVITVSTLVGCRHHFSGESKSRNFCCLEHEIQVSCCCCLCRW